MPGKGIGGDHILRDERLRRRHQPRIGGDVGRAARARLARIVPEALERPAAATVPQQRDRIGQIGIEQLMMRDHLDHAAVRAQRRAVRRQCPVICPHPLDHPNRGRRAQQAVGGHRRHRPVARERLGRDRPRRQPVEHPQFHARRQNL